jgi:glycosyltransferase involved in cell wall biosynthesis
MSEHATPTPDGVTVSVIIPFCAKYTPREMLDRAIDSVEAQVGVDTEVIVVEDEDERGPAWARNVGLERADTRYVAYLDGDDVWDEDKLERQLDRMAETGAGMCVDGDVDYDPIEFAGALLTGETFALTSSILLDTERTDARFEESLDRREDHLYLIEVAAEAGVCFCADTFVAGKYEEGLSKHVDTSPEQIQGFFELVADRVPAVGRFEDEYYQNAYVYLGRSRQAEGKYLAALGYYVESLRHGPNVLAVGAFGLTLLEGAYDYLTRPARRLLAGGTHDR